MKIVELFEAKTDQDIYDYVDDLIDNHKIKKLGMGDYGVVFQHPSDPNLAVKVMRSDEGNSIAFLKYARKNWKSNPWLPKIFKIHEYEHNDSGDQYYIVFMEKLKPLPKPKYKEFMEKELGIKDEGQSGFYLGNDIGHDTIEDVVKVAKDKKLKAVLDFISHYEFNTDLGVANLMLRGDQIVFVDPISD
jgi:hypothetical protein